MTREPGREHKSTLSDHEIRRGIAVNEAFHKLEDARRKDMALAAQGAEGSRRFLVRSGENRIVPATHIRIKLIPEPRANKIDSIREAIIRIPILPTKSAPDVIRKAFNKRYPLAPFNGDEITTEDIFVEAVKEDNHRQLFLLSEGNFLPYTSSDNIVPDPENAEARQQFFAIRSLTEELLVDQLTQAIDPSDLFEVLSAYELDLQDNLPPAQALSA